MAEAHVAPEIPYAIELAPGDYWCAAAGGSKSQPLCDGTHKTTEFTPVKLPSTKAEKVWLVRLQAHAQPAVLRRNHKTLQAARLLSYFFAAVQRPPARQSVRKSLPS